MVRYRREAFGYLAAFPNGRIGAYRESAEPTLRRGGLYEECAPHLLQTLTVDTGFHFSAPLMVWLEITRACNLECPHCFVEGGLKRASELSTSRILGILEELAEMGVFSVVVTGGEPTIHPDFLRIVHRAHELGFVVGIATNGMPLTDRLLEQMPRDDVIVSLSIDGVHGQGARLGLSDFEFVTGRLREIQQRGFRTSIMSTTTRDNVDSLVDVVAWAAANDVSFRSVPFVPMGRGDLNRQLMNTPADVHSAARFWIAEQQWEREKDSRIGLCGGKVFNFLISMAFATRRCMSGRGICYVNSNGDVYPCTTCSGAKILCGGNVRNASMRDVWERDWEIRRITWDDFKATCATCPLNDAAYYCTGRCPGSSYVHNRNLSGCGMTPFQKESLVIRERLFREKVLDEPIVPLSIGEEPVSGGRVTSCE